MNTKDGGFISMAVGAVVLAAVLLSGLYFIPWQAIDWGKIQLASPRTITVVGEAETSQKSQIATFNAGVTVVNDSKEAAVEETNSKVKAIIETVKEFGVKDEDIKTQSLNIYQNQETYWEEGRQKTRPGQWSVSNTVSIVLHDVDRASTLADKLAQSGATNVYGPNFQLDDTSAAQNSLLAEAISNARDKAAIIAGAEGKKVGDILSITEGYQAQPVYRPMEGGGGGGAPLEPGSGTISKAVTVVFELE